MRDYRILILVIALATVLPTSMAMAQGVNFWFAQQGDPSGTSIGTINVEEGSSFSISLWYQTSDSWAHNAVELLVGFDRAASFGAGAVALDHKLTLQGTSGITFPNVLANNLGGAYSQSSGDRPYGAHLALGAALGTTVVASSPSRIANLTLVNAAIPAGNYYDMVIWDAGAESRWTSFATMRSNIRRDSTAAVLRVNSTPGTAPEYTINEWKQLADGERGKLPGYEVTVDVGGSFFVEESNRSAGIRVATPVGVTVTPGDRATITGTIQTTADGERYVDASSVGLVSQPVSIEPLGMVCRALGGSSWLYNESTGAGQVGVKTGSGVNNVGLLVVAWGRPILTGDSDSFAIDDGSGVDVRVQLPTGQTHSWTEGNLPGFVSVTGASGLMKHPDDSYTSVIHIGDFASDVLPIL